MTRMNPDDRRHQLLDAAITQARKVGYQNVTRDAIAAEAGVSAGLVSRYFNTMTQVKRAVMREAVTRGELCIIAQGLACGDPHAKKVTAEIREQALATL